MNSLNNFNVIKDEKDKHSKYIYNKLLNLAEKITQQ
jgi:hypothetical protein